MGKLLMLALCCSVLAASQAHQQNLDKNRSSLRNEAKQGHIDTLKDNYVKQLFSQLLGRKLLASSRKRHIRYEQSNNAGLSRLEAPKVSGSVIAPTMPEALMLHRELQNRLGWGSDENNGNGNKNQHRPPPSFSQPNQQYGPPHQKNQQNGPPPAPSQQYGPPPPPNQQYGPPPQQNQQYGPPPPPNQQYGPPPQQNQQYGPPPQQNQQYGPPPPPNQQYGPPPQQNQQYGPPPQQNQQYGPPPPPNQQYGPPPQQNQQYGPPPQQNQQYGPPPQQNQQYGPPSQQNQQYGPPPPPNQQYGPPPEPNQQYGPPSQVNQEYGPPKEPNQEYGPPQQSNNFRDSGKNHIRVNQGTFGGHIENFKLSDALTKDNIGLSPPPQNQYGPPSMNEISSFKNDQGPSENPKIYKHVYIHTPPIEPEVQQRPRVIRPNTKQDVHYQVIFVKAPAPPQQPPTEIELPSPPERKTLVYVLVKKQEKPAEIKFRAPPPTQPAKPEVYFIRYKGNQKNNGGGYDGGQEQSPPEIQSIRDFGGDASIGDNDAYSNSYDSPSQNLGGTRTLEAPIASIVNNRLRESVDYPNTEYRAPPNMLNPNQEPMSIAVYDRVRNGVMPSNSVGRSEGSLIAASSNLISQTARLQQQGSHYTAPGSKPFKKASGKMVDGQYMGMTSKVLNSHFYTNNRRSSSYD